MNKKIVHILISSIILSIFIFQGNVFGADSSNTTSSTSNASTAPTIPKPATLPGPASGNAVENNGYLTDNLIPALVRDLLGILGIASFIFMIYGGVAYLTAYGDTSRADAGKKSIKYALIGLIVGMLSYSIVSILSYIDGIKPTQNPKEICPEGQSITGNGACGVPASDSSSSSNNSGDGDYMITQAE